MNKVKQFLELYVQWLAMALGGAFLLWMVYGFVISHPVTAPVGPTSEVVPGEIDTKIWDEKGKALQDAVNSRDVPKTMPQVSDIVSVVQGELENSPQFALAGPYTPLVPPVDTGSGPDLSAPTQGAVVTALPELPPILDLKLSGGRSNVPAPAPVGQVGDAVPPAPAPGGHVAAVDKSWRTIMGRIPVGDLDKAFAAAKIPAKLYSTAVLRVELVRQEMDAAGKFGPEEGVEVPALACNAMTALPPDNAGSGQQNDYQQWAETNYALVMQPPFYTVLQGDIWYLPGTKNPNEVQIQLVAFDPATFKGDPSTLSPEDLKTYNAWKRAQQKAKADAARAQHATTPQAPTVPTDGAPGGGNPGGTGSGNRGTKGGRSGRSGLAQDPERPPVATLPPPEAGMPPPGLGAGPMPGAAQPSVADTAAVTAAAATLPHGSFDPSKQGDIIVWAHDDTVQAGKTYRYKLRYVISNPVARSVGLCNPQSLAQQYHIVSKDSAWTDPVSVESDTNFYAVNANPARNEVSFDVFHWKDGVWQMETVKVTPGDMVGGVDSATKTDFTTGWTLVDVRTDPRDETITILLASDNGTVLKKDKNTDLHNSEYRKLLDQVKQQREKDGTKTASAQP